MLLRHRFSVKNKWANLLILFLLTLSIISLHYYFSASASTKAVAPHGIVSEWDFDNGFNEVNDKKIDHKKEDQKKEPHQQEGNKNQQINDAERGEDVSIDEYEREQMMDEDIKDLEDSNKDDSENVQENDQENTEEISNEEHKVDKKVVMKLIENIDESGTKMNDAIIEKFEKILDEGIKNENQPGPLEDSFYSQNEQGAVSEEDSKKIEKEINLLMETSDLDINPADPDKDWSLKYSKQLNTVTSQDLFEGNKHIRNFFHEVASLMHGNRLSFPLEQRMRMENGKTIIDPVITRADWEDNLSEKELETLFHFPDKFIKDATIKHKIVTDNIPDITPNFYRGDGYVIVGGGKYSWFSLLAIETLRKIGSKLPVEVFIPSADEYEKEFCEVVLPKYNARCIQIGNIFDKNTLEKMKITGYQYKSIALLASSFENAFLLDSDNYPVKNPDPIFESELYLSNTMITWPDYWRRTTSPHYYKIIGKTLGKQVRFLDDEDTDPKYYTSAIQLSEEDLKEKVQLHNREGAIKEWTTESGQMLINKKIQFRALLLALYYNLEGQFGYYPLLSQGGAGEGDKETFVAATTYYGLKYYQVRKKPDRAYGFYKWRGFFIDTSIIQYDPIRDFRVLQHINREIDSRIELDGKEFKYNYFDLQQHKISVEISSPMFYHVHETKMDPFKLYQDKATYDENGGKLRNLGGDFPRFGFDLETFLWKKTKQHLCVDNTEVAFLTDNEKSQLKQDICGGFMKEQLRFLYKSNRILRKKYDYASPYQNLERSQNII